MASSSNIGLVPLPWGRLPRSPVSIPSGRGSGSALEVSFRDIMAEQQKESCQEQDFDEYIQNSYVTVGKTSTGVTSAAAVVVVDDTEEKDDIPEVEKSFLQLEDLDTDLQLVMSFYEDQDFDDASYELSEQDLDDLPDDDSDKYYEGLAKKLSTVVELQSNSLTKSVNSSSSKGNKGSRTTGSLPQNLDTLFDLQSKVILDKLKRKGVLRGASSSSFRAMRIGQNSIILHAAGGIKTIVLSTRILTGKALSFPKVFTLLQSRHFHDAPQAPLSVIANSDLDNNWKLQNL